MTLSSVQIGVIAQNEFAKLLMIGSDGLLEVSAPLTDDDRRDADVHVRGQFGQGLAFQIKSSTRLPHLPGGKAPMLNVAFTVKAERLISHPRFYYYISDMSLTTAAFIDPQFLVESTKIHKHAAPRLIRGVWHFTFNANMTDHAGDVWVPERVRGLEVASRVMQRLRDLEKLPTAERALPDLSDLPRVVLVRRRVR